MLQTRRKTAMYSPHPSRCATPLLALILLALTGCAQTPSAEPQLIVRKPKPAPLPAAVLRIDSKPTTDTLSKGQAWLQSTDKLLSGVTQK